MRADRAKAEWQYVGVALMTEGRLAYAEDLTRVSRQIVGVVLVSWQRVLRTGLCIAFMALLLTEIISCVMTGSFPPAPATHLVAVALAVALGYGAAVTTLFVMLLRGGVAFIRHLEGEAEAGTRAASVFARREVGDLAAGLRRVLSSHTSKDHDRQPRPITRSMPVARPRPIVAPRTAVAAATVATVGGDIARVAVPRVSAMPPPPGYRPDTRRDPDDAIIRTPAPTMQSLPVLAARLPRIEWTYDDQRSLAQMPLQKAPYTAPIAATAPKIAELAATIPEPAPHDKVRGLAADESRQSVAVVHDAKADDDGTLADTDLVNDEPRGTADVPGLIPRGWRRSGSITRPLPAITRPLPAVTRPIGGARSGGLWERVSQALVGEATATASESGDAAEPGLANHWLPENEVAPEDAWLNG